MAAKQESDMAKKAGVVEEVLPASRHRWVGLLDAFGFELLQSNSFEQLLINATNERLQNFFIQCVMKAEQSLYEAEKVPWQGVPYSDNAKTIALLHTGRRGVLPLVDEECRAIPAGNDTKLAKAIQESLEAAGHPQSHMRPKPAQGERQEKARAAIKTLFAAGTPHFSVQHFAGEVTYEVVGWLDKNSDVLFDDMKTLLLASSHKMISELFSPRLLAAEAAEAAAFAAESDDAPKEAKKVEKAGPPKAGRLGGATGNTVRPPTIATRFSGELKSLMGELERSNVHFVRCIKPNDGLVPDRPNATMLLDQLLFSGMLEAVKLMRAMFPGRIPFVEIHRRFIGKLPRSVTAMSPGDFIRAVIDAIDLPKESYLLGTSRLFFRSGGADFLRELAHASADDLVELLHDKMMMWHSKNAMLPAAVLGVKGRQIARYRRWAVGTIQCGCRKKLGQNYFQRARHACVTIQVRRRKQVYDRTAEQRRGAQTTVAKFVRGRAAVKLRDQLRRRRDAQAALVALLDLPPAKLDLDDLAARLARAVAEKVAAVKLTAGRHKHDTVTNLRARCIAGIEAVASVPLARRDLDALTEAIAAAREAGVSATAIAEIEAKASDMTPSPSCTAVGACACSGDPQQENVGPPARPAAVRR